MAAHDLHSWLSWRLLTLFVPENDITLDILHPWEEWCGDGSGKDFVQSCIDFWQCLGPRGLTIVTLTIDAVVNNGEIQQDLLRWQAGDTLSLHGVASRLLQKTLYEDVEKFASRMWPGQDAEDLTHTALWWVMEELDLRLCFEPVLSSATGEKKHKDRASGWQPCFQGKFSERKELTPGQPFDWRGERSFVTWVKDRWRKRCFDVWRHQTPMQNVKEKQYNPLTRKSEEKTRRVMVPHSPFETTDDSNEEQPRAAQEYLHSSAPHPDAAFEHLTNLRMVLQTLEQEAQRLRRENKKRSAEIAEIILRYVKIQIIEATSRDSDIEHDMSVGSASTLVEGAVDTLLDGIVDQLLDIDTAAHHVFENEETEVDESQDRLGGLWRFVRKELNLEGRENRDTFYQSRKRFFREIHLEFPEWSRSRSRQKKGK